ncbi:MAG: hypothetical protein F4Z75_06905 [Synechococcus sp. SB0668_bin_15]|nr:hypothetical protein [Synechococcus sp. SB0668_bin_15]MXZ83001.1 hypothetical protein [Synechococcus sp. SB0666_bin_14]MYA90589.1 hypothetical protein [Synechococcus sp. SB0663_bin_10]MYC49069.1 hypothetical protein [Synechococcus sp. SB0662_bin_14]MYG46434.1 hypothetical protein [Synechococcus sp. SB0675_bin_6]MYJ59252.1 hypothetical protein [Synechococcus sp. SB0672_bin_6]MYK91587.1 hypothetical protein [Synechococcus sp. SB0669_bin_8]
MTASSPTTAKLSGQTTTTPVLGGALHEWRQWLAPGVVVTVVLAMGALQRADIRELSGKVDRINTELTADIRDVNGRLDRVNKRLDQVNMGLDRVTDQMNGRLDQIYQLLLP